MNTDADAATLEGPPSLPPNRKFGLLWVVVFSGVAAWTWWAGAKATPWLIAALGTACVTALAPRLLTPFNRAWMRLASLMHAAISPLVLGIMFFGLVTPYGWCRRLIGGDPLARRWEPERESYWIDRKPPGPPADSFPHQF